jgi:hypothetical protein
MAGLKRIGWLIVTLAPCTLLTLWFARVFGFRSPLFALLLNWMAMTWVALAGQAIQFTLPARYYDFKPYEQAGQVYERLGIRLFKRLVRRGPLSWLNPTLRLSSRRTLADLHQLDQKMRQAETSHVYLFWFMVLFISYALWRQWFDAAGWLLAFNGIINGYPILLQRYNRIRVQRLLQGQEGWPA